MNVGTGFNSKDRSGSNNRSRGGERPQTSGVGDGGQSTEEVFMGDRVQPHPKTPNEGQKRQRNVAKPSADDVADQIQ